MSEMSLVQQIALVKEMKDYIEKVVSETDNMRNEVNAMVNFLRREGLPTEVADHFMGSLYKNHVNSELDKLLNEICNEDYAYLEDVQQGLEEALRY